MKKLCAEEIAAIFDQAKKERFAIPAFNYSDIWDMRGIVEAAEELRSPVILMCDSPTYKELGGEMCCRMADILIEKASVPVIHHLDHSESYTNCVEAIDFGFTSVMIDASSLPVKENSAVVKKVVDYAHARGVIVEAEIGRILSESEYEPKYTGEDYLFKLDEALYLVNESGCDTLAIGIGNAHGFYKGDPVINFKKLEEARSAIDIPLVLHGGTGIPEDIISKCIDGGIRKVNVGTAVYCAYMNGIREKLIASGENQFTYDVMHYAMDKIKNVIRSWIKACRADGKAN